MLVTLSALGLAELGDPADIPLLIQASSAASASESIFVRALLVYARRGSEIREAVLRAVTGTSLSEAYLREERGAVESPKRLSHYREVHRRARGRNRRR